MLLCWYIWWSMNHPTMMDYRCDIHTWFSCKMTKTMMMTTMSWKGITPRPVQQKCRRSAQLEFHYFKLQLNKLTLFIGDGDASWSTSPSSSFYSSRFGRWQVFSISYYIHRVSVAVGLLGVLFRSWKSSSNSFSAWGERLGRIRPGHGPRDDRGKLWVNVTCCGSDFKRFQAIGTPTDYIAT